MVVEAPGTRGSTEFRVDYRVYRQQNRRDQVLLILPIALACCTGHRHRWPALIRFEHNRVNLL
jgi:hypothetical protein